MQEIINPGAMRFGNFINYYQYHKAEDRMKLLPVDIWLKGSKHENNNNDINQPYLLLDVGCNTGELTQLCWKHITSNCKGRPVHVLGIDLDEILIIRAIELNTQHKEYISYACIDVMNQNAFATTIEKFLGNFGQKKFDAICCFSITMWIHLNHHDAGLQQFLQRLSDLTDLLVIEPQPWKCYQNAKKRMQSIGQEFPIFLQLKWRTNLEKIIDDFIQTKLQRHRVHKTERTPWQRSLYFYR